MAQQEQESTGEGTRLVDAVKRPPTPAEDERKQAAIKEYEQTIKEFAERTVSPFAEAKLNASRR